MSFVWSLALSLQFLFICSLFSSTHANSFPLTHSTKCHEDESNALLQFKAGFVISKNASSYAFSYPKTATWIPSTDCCSWKGIECDELSGHVIVIDLSSSQLYGSMDANSTLFHLVHLQSLNLSDNDFNYSQIPSRIGELSKLRHLNLSKTAFMGEIPAQISQLSNLLSLDLRSNALPYSYPPVNLLQLKVSNLKSLIQNSTKLEILLLCYVTISSPVPDIITNLTSLQALYLYYCDLYGEFPVGVFHLPKLRYLVLGYNQNLYGKLPEFNSSPLSYIELDSTGFYGTLPASIGNLNFLNTLSIGHCNFFGSIPSSLGNLTQLIGLYIESNQFKGQLPSSLENLSKVRYLGLGFNELAVETISWIGKLSQLSSLDLSSINYGGELPFCFANLTQLSYLSLPDSNLSGEIPSWIMNLTNLAYLDLGGNHLHGEIPHSLFKLENLATLSLSLNSLQGQLEFDMFLKLKMLSFLWLSNNYNLSLLVGKVSSNATLPPLEELVLGSCNLVEFPVVIRDLNKLGSLDMSDNDLKSIPKWIWRKRGLQGLILSHSSLTGEISPLICNLKSLEYLDLSYNNLSGIIPSCLGSFSQSLQTLILQGNKFVGRIPQNFMKGSALQMIALRDNNLHGQLPRALVNCRMLEFLDVSNNMINDSFPCWLGSLPELKVIALRNNDFYGAIMCPKRCKFPKLHIIDLSHNKFSGNLLPDTIKSWKSMAVSNISQLAYEDNNIYLMRGKRWAHYTDYAFTMSTKGVDLNYEVLQRFYYLVAIDLSGNRICGEIPDVMGDLKNLVLLNLSNNMLSGSIPSSLGKLSKLESLDLSHNSLSGKIPQQLTELTFLEFFNVSFNNLSGPIPESKQFSTFQGTSFEGNQGLCGSQLAKKCEDHAMLQLPASNGDQESDWGCFIEFDWKVIVIGYGGGLVAGLALGNAFSSDIIRWLKSIF